MAYALIAALVVLCAAMAAIALVSLRLGHSRLIDAVWSLATGMVAAVLVLVPHWGSLGVRQGVLATLILLWGLRLGLHLLQRPHQAGDDPRYVALREEWGAKAGINLVKFLQYQAIAGWLLCLSVMASSAASVHLRLIDGPGFLVMIVALLGERLADRQLQAYRADPSLSKVCDRGLWGMSRHPNYFFEWLFWVGCALLGFGQSIGLTLAAFIAPVAMYVLLVHVSGIPPLEAHMLRSRGEAYKDYMRRVPPFFPKLWPEAKGR